MLNLKVLAQKINEAAELAISYIKENTLKGQSYEGANFTAYSSNPFKIPYGKYIEQTTDTFRKSYEGKTRKREDKGNVAFYQSKNNQKWVIIKRGYAHYKSSRFPQTGSTVNLAWRHLHNGGGMLSGVRVKKLASKSNLTAIIGFTDAGLEQLGIYHQFMGASKGKKIRRWFGLTPEQQQLIINKLKEAVQISSE